jgi:hypothetical protein
LGRIRVSQSGDSDRLLRDSRLIAFKKLALHHDAIIAATNLCAHIGQGLSDCEAGKHAHFFQGVARCHPDTGWKPMLAS